MCSCGQTHGAGGGTVDPRLTQPRVTAPTNSQVGTAPNTQTPPQYQFGGQPLQ